MKWFLHLLGVLLLAGLIVYLGQRWNDSGMDASLLSERFLDGSTEREEEDAQADWIKEAMEAPEAVYQESAKLGEAGDVIKSEQVLNLSGKDALEEKVSREERLAAITARSREQSVQPVFHEGTDEAATLGYAFGEDFASMAAPQVSDSDSVEMRALIEKIKEKRRKRFLSEQQP